MADQRLERAKKKLNSESFRKLTERVNYEDLSVKQRELADVIGVEALRGSGREKRIHTGEPLVRSAGTGSANPRGFRQRHADAADSEPLWDQR